MIKLKITSVKKINTKKKVYDLTVSKNHNFFIGDNNEILTHNCTHVLEASQVLLLNMMETFSLKTRFILTGNYPERLIEPLLSRLQCYELTPPTKPDVARHLSKILELENAEFDIKDLSKIINQHYPDIRSIINSIQKYTIDGKLSIGDAKLYDKDYKEKIIKILSNPTSKSIIDIRQILVDANINNYEEFYRFLYKNVDKFSSKNISEAIINIEEYRYRSTMRVDQEITMCALLSKLIEINK
jgi:replication factor C small subunit